MCFCHCWRFDISQASSGRVCFPFIEWHFALSSPPGSLTLLPSGRLSPGLQASSPLACILSKGIAAHCSILPPAGDSPRMHVFSLGLCIHPSSSVCLLDIVWVVYTQLQCLALKSTSARSCRDQKVIWCALCVIPHHITLVLTPALSLSHHHLSLAWTQPWLCDHPPRVPFLLHLNLFHAETKAVVHSCTHALIKELSPAEN